MIQIEREKLEKVLEALYCLQPSAWEINADLGADADKAITIIKDVLAQKDSEPAAWMYPDDLKRFQTSETFAQAYSIEVVSLTQGKTIPLYTKEQL